jgi:predicted nucleotidyltransferase
MQGSGSHAVSLERLTELLAGRPGVRLALLFGSQARGEAHAGSDLDLGVEAEQGFDLAQLGGELTLALSVPVDVVSIDPGEASIALLEELLRDARPIDEAYPGAFVSWLSRTLALLETDRPAHAKMRDAYLRRVASQGFGHGQS